MINVYPNQCEGKQWFLPDPVGVPGCDAEGMRQWWVKKQTDEAEKVQHEKTNNGEI